MHEPEARQVGQRQRLLAAARLELTSAVVGDARERIRAHVPESIRVIGCADAERVQYQYDCLAHDLFPACQRRLLLA